MQFFAGLWQAFRLAARTLAKSPGFTAIAVVALGLGLGVSTYVFGAVNRLLLQPISARDPAQLVTIVIGPSAEASRHAVAFWPRLSTQRAGGRPDNRDHQSTPGRELLEAPTSYLLFPSNLPHLGDSNWTMNSMLIRARSQRDMRRSPSAYATKLNNWTLVFPSR